MHSMTFGVVGVRGVGCMRGLLVCIMSGLSLARHVHGIVRHVQWNNHCGIVFSCGPRVLVACIYQCVVSRMFN